MSSERGRGVFVILLLLMAGCGIVLALDKGRPRTIAESRFFQQAVGGLGFGPATTLTGCPAAFDPRLEDSCSADVGPLPGGQCFCGRHAGRLPSTGDAHPHAD